MDLDRLSEFLVIAEEASFQNAAKKLGLAPSVLSSRFSAFERSVGVRLIDRSARSFSLTSAGKEFLPEAKKIRHDYEETVSSLRKLSGSSFRSLRLQLCAQTMPAELGPFLDQYCRQYPRLFLDLYDENSCRIREGLLSGKVDISFAVGRKNDFQDISGRIILGRFPRMKVHLPTDHRLAYRNKLSFADLDGETFILYPNMKESWTRKLQLQLLQESGISYYIYEENCSPFFFDLLVPINKGIRLWNWNNHTAPNTVLVTLQDAGFETCLFMLFDEAAENPTCRNFIDRFLLFREERR